MYLSRLMVVPAICAIFVGALPSPQGDSWGTEPSDERGNALQPGPEGLRALGYTALGVTGVWFLMDRKHRKLRNELEGARNDIDRLRSDMNDAHRGFEYTQNGIQRDLNDHQRALKIRIVDLEQDVARLKANGQSQLKRMDISVLMRQFPECEARILEVLGVSTVPGAVTLVSGEEFKRAARQCGLDLQGLPEKGFIEMITTSVGKVSASAPPPVDDGGDQGKPSEYSLGDIGNTVKNSFMSTFFKDPEVAPGQPVGGLQFQRSRLGIR